MSRKRTFTEGPLGFPMPDALAKSLEQLIKTLPKDSAYSYRKGTGQAVELVKGEKADISLVSTDCIDRDGEVVLPKGVDLSYFQKNPIVTFAHKYDELPVGKAQWIRQVEGGIKAKTVYTDAHDLARACWQMTAEGILKGKSIGFLPTKIRPPNGEEPEWKNASAVIESAVLLEYAVAPIPVCPEALVEAVAKGYADEALLTKLGLKLPTKPAKKSARPRKAGPDILTLFLKQLQTIRIDPNRIADEVFRRIAERGRV
jgi:hypothetical protein